MREFGDCPQKIQNANLASADADFAVQDAKIPAINKGTNKEEYVTNDFLVKVWVRISEATGEMPVTRIERKYKNIVKSEADAVAAVWADNAEEFLGLAKLSTTPGYPSEEAFAAALYRLARKYPSAAHFRWV